MTDHPEDIEALKEDTIAAGYDQQSGLFRRALMLLFAVLLWGISLGLWFGVAGGIGAYLLIGGYAHDLPDHSFLAKYEPPVTTRIHAGDGRLLAEFAQERRVFVPIENIPQQVILAFLSAEDRDFYNHNGLDFRGIVRASLYNLRSAYTGQGGMQGASTITQQVAKNFLLTSERNLDRKIREAILASRIEEALSKDRILELYLNEIYLGARAYGVAAAALHYFDKSLLELTLAETAFIAGLPKAPNNYHPQRNPERAVARRADVLGQMLRNGVISQAEYERAMAEPLVMTGRGDPEFVQADYFIEEMRRDLVRGLGADRLYQGGLSVHSTLDPRLQSFAESALREGLVDYDRRHGYRGPEMRIRNYTTWQDQLNLFNRRDGVEEWDLALVYQLDEDHAKIAFADETGGRIPLSELKWARRVLTDEEGKTTLGAAIAHPQDALAAGDVVLVERMADQSEAGRTAQGFAEPAYHLRQVPELNGAVVAMDPHTGRVLAMAGGFNFEHSQFNRATQALRQPGSSFKPFVYLAGLEAGFTPSSLILDAPYVMMQQDGSRWRPSNYSRRFYGPTPMRVGMEQSRNLMTIRLATYIGMDRIAKAAADFGVIDNMPEVLSMSLGSGETTLLRLTTAYSMLVNGGKKIQPSMIDRVQNHLGRTIYRHDARPCAACRNQPLQAAQLPPPALPDPRAQLTDPRHAYQIVSMLEGAVQRGTGQRLQSIGVPLAGKTGTTNNNRDAWFIGFSPDLVVGVYTGFDTPHGLGEGETGGAVAAPIAESFFARALEGQPGIPFRVPPGLRLVQVDPRTGEVAKTSRNAIWEAFIPGTEPDRVTQFLGGGETGEDVQLIDLNTYGTSSPDAGIGTGGIY